MDIKLNQIHANPDQPRQTFLTAGLLNLAISIKENGIIQPIVVEKNGSGYIIHDGERRYRASLILAVAEEKKLEINTDRESDFYKLVSDTANQSNLETLKDNYLLAIKNKTVNCTLANNTEETTDLLTRALVANIQREELNPIEIAKSIDDLLQRKLKPTTIAHKIGMDRTTIINLHSLLKLPSSIQEKVVSGEISQRKALALVSYYQLNKAIKDELEDDKELCAVLDNVESNSMETIRETTTNAIEKRYQQLNKDDFDFNDTFPVNESIARETCTDCVYILTHNRAKYCTNSKCYQEKKDYALKNELSLAQEYFPIKISTDPMFSGSNKTIFFKNSIYATEAIKIALSKKCSCLHICKSHSHENEHYPTTTPPYFTTDNDHQNILPGSFICIHKKESAACECLTTATKSQINQQIEKEQSQNTAFETYYNEIQAELEKIPHHIINLIYWSIMPFYEAKQESFTKEMLENPRQTRQKLGETLTNTYKSRNYQTDIPPSKIEQNIYKFLNSFHFINSENANVSFYSRCDICGFAITNGVGHKLISVKRDKMKRKYKPRDKQQPPLTVAVCSICEKDKPNKVDEIQADLEKYWCTEDPKKKVAQ